jgi:deoxyribonuclease-1
VTRSFRSLPSRPSLLGAGLAGLAGLAAGCASTASGDGSPRAVRDKPEAPALAAPNAPTPPNAHASGNTRIATFEDAKRLLVRLYLDHSPRTDIYCGCPFGEAKGHGLRVDLAACGYATHKDEARAERIEWEHAVPAAKFGRTFAAWREGAPRCTDGHGKKFRGRACAKVASPEFAKIEGDMHNLFPAVGEVNGLRGDLPMGLREDDDGRTHRGREDAAGASTIHFGKCASTVEGTMFLPRTEVRGDIARAYKYMNAAYPDHVALDEAHRALLDAWDADDPPDAWERERNRRITELQGNANPFVLAHDKP